MTQVQPTQEPKAITPPSDNQSVTDNQEVIDRAAYEQVKADMHKYKEKLKLREDQLKTIETEKLKGDQKWKELAEIKEREAQEAQEKYNKLNSAVVEDKKMTEIRKEAVKLGVRPQALDDLDVQNWSDVGIEFTSTGRVNVIGAAKAVERLKTIKPYLFDEPRAPGVNPGVPHVVPGQSGGPITVKDISTAEADAKKTGDYSKYRELLVAFQRQRKT